MTPRTPEQFEQIRTEKKALIRQAALECFAQSGLHGTSIAEIAKKAKISKGLIYNYFDSKEAMVHDIVEDLFHTVYHRFKIPEEGPLTDDLMEQFMITSIDLVLEDPQKYTLHFKLLTERDIIQLFMEDMMKRMQPMIMKFIEYYAAKGYEDPVSMMRFVSAAIDGVQMHIMLDPENFPAEQSKKLLVETFVKRK